MLAVVPQYPSGPAITAAGVEQLTAALKAERDEVNAVLSKYPLTVSTTVTIGPLETVAAPV